MSPPASFIIQDAVVLITGVNKPNGMGRAILGALIAKGASKVYATARRISELEDLVAQYPTGVIVPIALDVTDLDTIAMPTLYPDVTILINNAGIFAGSSSISSIEKAMMEINVNYTGPLALGHAYAPVFAKLGAATENGDTTTKATSALININSVASLINFPLGGTYSASKAASHSLTQAQRRDFAPYHTLVIGVYPGMIDTAMGKEADVPKASTSVVSDAIIEALELGIEDIFPDPLAKELYNGWKADPKGMEQNMAAQYA